MALFAPASSHEVSVEVTAARADVPGANFHWTLPAGGKISPAKQAFHLATAGERGKFSFTVTAPPQSATAQITARAKIGNATFDNQHIEICYAHIPETTSPAAGAHQGGQP